MDMVAREKLGAAKHAGFTFTDRAEFECHEMTGSGAGGPAALGTVCDIPSSKLEICSGFITREKAWRGRMAGRIPS